MHCFRDPDRLIDRANVAFIRRRVRHPRRPRKPIHRITWRSMGVTLLTDERQTLIQQHRLNRSTHSARKHLHTKITSVQKGRIRRRWYNIHEMSEMVAPRGYTRKTRFPTHGALREHGVHPGGGQQRWRWGRFCRQPQMAAGATQR
jgi:hypothetical protein